MAKPEGSSDSTKLSAEDRQRFKDLFIKLDVNKDGSIEVSELAAALRLQKIPEKQAVGHAKVRFTASGHDRSAPQPTDITGIFSVVDNPV